MQYESPITSGKKVMAKVKVFRKEVKLQGQKLKKMKIGTDENKAIYSTQVWVLTGYGYQYINMLQCFLCLI